MNITQALFVAWKKSQAHSEYEKLFRMQVVRCY